MRSTNKRYNTVCRLGLYRTKIKLSQEQLGREMKLSKKTIARFENGETIPTVDVAIGFSKYFNVPVEELFKVSVREDYDNE